MYKRYKKLFDEFSARNQGNNAAEISAVNTTSEAYALAKDSENDYNNQKGVENGQETTETTKTTEAKENGRSNESLRGSRGRGISVFNDYGTVRQLSEIVKNTETVQKIGDFFTEIYTEPQTDTQENLVWHAKNEDINKKPTDSNDIRYALPTEDNSGKQLSQQQSNYFKDSKIKDKQGRLIVAYHGTNSQFYTFRNKGAVNGRSQGDGFYFTANNEFATEYGSRVITAYLNIKNPFYLHEKRTIQSELEHRGYDIKELAGKYGIELNEFDGISWGKDEKTLLTKMGYDGVISVWGEEDTISTNAEDRTIIVAYKSNQIKEVTNSTPTKESDIRFALQEDENSTIGGLTKGQRAKFVANNTKFKVYSKLDATEVINSIISERLVFDDKYGTLSGKSKAEVIDRLFTKLNSANEGYRTGVALNIADYILENAVLEDMYDLTDKVGQSVKIYFLIFSSMK